MTDYVAIRTTTSNNTGDWYTNTNGTTYYPYTPYTTTPSWVSNIFQYPSTCRKCGKSDKDTKLLSNGYCERCDANEYGIPYDKLRALLELVYVPFVSEADPDGV